MKVSVPEFPPIGPGKETPDFKLALVMQAPGAYNKYMSRLNPSSRIDKTAFSVASLSDESDDKAYWLSKTPHERLEAIEVMRQTLYGYDPSTARLQRVLTVAELESS